MVLKYLGLFETGLDWLQTGKVGSKMVNAGSELALNWFGSVLKWFQLVLNWLAFFFAFALVHSKLVLFRTN